MFHRADVTFVTKSADPDSVLTNLSELFVGDAINLQQQALQPGTRFCTAVIILFLIYFLFLPLCSSTSVLCHSFLPMIYLLNDIVIIANIIYILMCITGESLTTTPHVLVTCSLRDRLSVVLNAMMLVRWQSCLSFFLSSFFCFFVSFFLSSFLPSFLPPLPLLYSVSCHTSWLIPFITHAYSLSSYISFVSLSNAVLSLPLRSTVVVCVNESGVCLGVISIKDIVKYYFDGNSTSRWFISKIKEIASKCNYYEMQEVHKKMYRHENQNSCYIVSKSKYVNIFIAVVMSSV